MKYTVLHTTGSFKTFAVSFEIVKAPFLFTIEADTLCGALNEAEYYFEHKDDSAFWEELDSLV